MTTKEMIAALQDALVPLRQDCYRRGNVIELNGPGRVVMSGDLHGNERNFHRLVRSAKLEDNPHHHLILHELLHCHESVTPDQCHSYELFVQAAQLKIRFPNQVHIVLGNHAMAQMTREEVLKGGKPMVRSLLNGLQSLYPTHAHHIIQAIDDYILTLPIAVRTSNKIWMSHSLPSLAHLQTLDDSIFCKTLTLDDFHNNPSLHAFAWDRVHSEDSIKKLKERWQVDHFIVGHKPQAQGKGHPFANLIILASEHSHGCYLPFDLNKTYTSDELYSCVRPLAEIA